MLSLIEDVQVFKVFNVINLFKVFKVFTVFNAELITGPVFTAKGRIRPFLGYLGRFWPVFGSQRQYF